MGSKIRKDCKVLTFDYMSVNTFFVQKISRERNISSYGRLENTVEYSEQKTFDCTQRAAIG